MVTHGGIDGYSRMITYLKYSNNNKSLTVTVATYIIVLSKQFNFIAFHHILDVTKDVKTDWLPNLCLSTVAQDVGVSF